MEKTVKHTRNFPSRIVKVVLYGPESTGKTTLAKALATHYKTVWVPEFMREYLTEKWENRGETIVKDDLVAIAKGQLDAEKKALKKANNVLVCDTNLLELKVYSEYYYDGYCPEFIKNEATKADYDIYLLTYIDVPWESDPLRDRPNNREEMFGRFESELKKQNFPYVVLHGNREQRLQQAVKHIDRLVEKNKK